MGVAAAGKLIAADGETPLTDFNKVGPESQHTPRHLLGLSTLDSRVICNLMTW